jgi:diaminohydroxyphosphoribosylaminopyrimidine deaminase/5-amino-6-(5-phosphoribosylamino)uracil reductase
MKLDEKYISIALRLAEKGRGATSPNPVVGAVIVKHGFIVGRGWHEFVGGPHAEINAIKDAGEKSRGADLFVTLEPCSTQGRTPPCTDAIIKAGIKTVVYGISDPNPRHSGRADEILRKAGIEVRHPVLEEKCHVSNEAFFKWISSKMPFLTLKLAMTLDAKIADFRGVSKWITSPTTRRRVQRLRLSSDAILVGAETVRRDRPSLTVRDFKRKVQPMRLVASTNLDIASAKKIFSSSRDGGEIRVINAKKKEQWLDVLKKLGEENISSILVEGGAKLASSLLQYGLIDKLEFHYAPMILGKGYDALQIPKRILSAGLKLKNAKFAKSGPDIIVTGYL